MLSPTDSPSTSEENDISETVCQKHLSGLASAASQTAHVITSVKLLAEGITT